MHCWSSKEARQGSNSLSGVACRTIFAPVASAMTCVVALLSAFTNLRWLLGCAMAFGFVFGWHWSLMPVCASVRVLSVRLELLSSGHTVIALLLDFCKLLTVKAPLVSEFVALYKFCSSKG